LNPIVPNEPGFFYPFGKLAENCGFFIFTG